ncbi:hypothetical protein [Beduini massiliensis]|uniref:hypothetical protein n=1 Tax=Beduini massiliensis TaxID=1585974 RepID=UPI00059A9EB7|nr:hypothetical protein [Beduini massiliensis]
MGIIILLLLFGGGAYVFASGMLTKEKNSSPSNVYDNSQSETTVQTSSSSESSINTPYYIYFKKGSYHDLSQDERFQDMGIWTVFKHETFKLETHCKREEVHKRIKETLNLTDNDFKVVGKMDLWVPIRF